MTTLNGKGNLTFAICQPIKNSLHSMLFTSIGNISQLAFVNFEQCISSVTRKILFNLRLKLVL